MSAYATDVEHLMLHPDNPTMHIHHKANTVGSGHEVLDVKFLHEVAQLVADAGAILIGGLGSAKAELVKHIQHHDPKVMKAVLGVETVDHPSDAQLVAHARKFFKSEDIMQPQK
jgi:hypothetical protein